MDDILQKAAERLSLPADVVAGAPRVEIIGCRQVFIENHRGVIEYTPQKLRIGVAFGEIIITGTDFFLKNIFSDELSLEGKIDSVVFYS